MPALALLVVLPLLQDPGARARALIEQLQNDDVPARRRAAEDLADLGAAGVPAILQALAGDPDSIQARVGDLVKRLSKADWKERDEATRALGRLGSAALPALKARSNESDPEVRWRVMAAIAEIEERGPQEAATASARDAALFEVLGRVADPRGVAPLLRATRENPPSPVLTRAVEALGRCRALLSEAQADEACEAALKAIDAPDPRGPLVPVRAAGLLRSALAVPKLVSLVEDASIPDAYLKREAMAGLVRLGGPAGMAAVIHQLGADDPYVREGAQATLAAASVPLAGFDPRLPAAGNEKAIAAARAWWAGTFKKPWED